MSDDFADNIRRGAHERQRDKVREISAEVHALAQLYRGCFATEAGLKVLDDLRRCYHDSTVGQTTRTTEMRSFQRDVLIRVEALLVMAEDAPGTLYPYDVPGLKRLINPWSET